MITFRELYYEKKTILNMAENRRIDWVRSILKLKRYNELYEKLGSKESVKKFIK